MTDLSNDESQQGGFLSQTSPSLSDGVEREVASYFDDYFSDEPGSIPGTLNIPDNTSFPQIHLIDYNETKAIRIPISTPEDCVSYLDTESVSWIDVQGLGSEDILKRLGQVFQLHPLVLEDMVNVPQRPKVEEYDNQLLIIARMVIPTQDERGFLVSRSVWC
jgi:magnesium transporter